MAITYNSSTNAGKVRLYIGDTIDKAGPRPNDDGVIGTNYSDEEIDLFLSSGGSINSAVILGFRTLAGEWTAFAVSEWGALERMDAKEVSDKYLKMVDLYTNNPIDAIGDNPLIINLVRVDAYSEA